jgi:predicted lactoylglutathione lyase
VKSLLRRAADPMKQRVAVVTLPVADLATSKSFYCNGLGWTPVFDDGDVAFFQFNGFVLGLWSRSSFDKDIEAQSVDKGYKMALGHNVESRAAVDQILAEAVAAGAKLLRPAVVHPWGGYSGNFADPDDHVWEVAHNPAWSISPEGYVTFSASK